MANYFVFVAIVQYPSGVEEVTEQDFRLLTHDKALLSWLDSY